MHSAQSSKPADFIFSVSEFLDVINELVGAQKFMIQGEISSISARGMNIFFTISDKKDGSLLDCYVHETKIRNLGTQLKVGMEIQVYGTAGIYKRNGKFNLTVQNINLVGEGALKQAYEQLKRELEQEGYFDPARKRPIPQYPESIGLITSANAAAKKDFLQNLTRKGIKIYFVDTRVEGLHSEDDVAKAIRFLNESTVKLDVIVITRGGGSWESLQAFNHKKVALAVAGSKVPIISAIGHEQDVLISDLVADFRASTPTHAAKFLSEEWNTAVSTIEAYEDAIYSQLKNSIRHHETFIQNTESTVNAAFERALFKRKYEIEQAQKQIVFSSQKMMDCMKVHEYRYAENTKLFARINLHKKENFEKQILDFQNYSQRWLKSVVKQLQFKELQLEGHNPEKRLKQGYSIITNEKGDIIKTSDYVKVDDILHVKVYKGKLDTKVIKK